MRSCFTKIILLIATLNITSAGAVTRNEKSKSPLQQARLQKTPYLKKLFKQRSIPYPPHAVFLRVLKRERELELWAKGAKGPYRQIKSYKICAASGELGPKRQSGDGQVPEGVYHINRFNPRSLFHLSLGINYPNRADRIHGSKGRLGGDIFLHGDCVSIGCVAITDDKIAELFLATAAVARRGRRRIPVHIFPARMGSEGYARLTRSHAQRPKLLQLWAELKPIYEFFEHHHKLPKVVIDSRGKYRLTSRPPADT